MDFISFLILIPWFFVALKSIFFWTYLWQLKDYHIKRFLAHFSTFKGKQLLFDKTRFIKIALLILTLFGIYNDDSSNIFFFIIALLILVLYILEAINAILKFKRKQLITPVFNKKTIALVGVALILLFTIAYLYIQRIEVSFYNPNYLYFYYIPLFILFFDIISPIFTSFVVLFFQPLTVAYRYYIINKAKKKLKQTLGLTVIGITGSYGKSSCKEFLYALIKDKYSVLKTPKNFNSEMGISQTILKDLKNNHEYFICEMGAYTVGGIKFLCDIVNPKIGILTGINQQHLATFGSQENIIKAKFELIDSLPEDGLAILNYDNSLIKKELETHKFACKNIKLISQIKNPYLTISKIKNKNGIISFDCSYNKDKASFELKIPGEESIIENMLLAISCALHLGMTMQEIADASKNITDDISPIKMAKSPDDIIVLDSSYSSNPNGVISTINYLSTFRGKRVLVMPCLIELGDESKRIHQIIGQSIAKNCDLAIITSKDYFNDIKQSALEAGFHESRIIFEENPEQVVSILKHFLNPGDVLLFENRVNSKIINEFLPTDKKHV
jgi:UDP-N-acetylmuramoyl-tripeptide--D-alanyl-D-alanine ligase